MIDTPPLADQIAAFRARVAYLAAELEKVAVWLELVREHFDTIRLTLERLERDAAGAAGGLE